MTHVDHDKQKWRVMSKKGFFYNIGLFLRSLLFSSIVIITVTFYSFFCVAAFILPTRYRCAMIAGWTSFMLWVLKVVCGIKVKVEGIKNIPKDSNGIVMCKHQSTWETFFLPQHFPQVAIILKKQLLWVPFFGWGLASTDPIAIDRSKKSSAMEQILKKGKEYLNKGRWILVFPEGTRIPYGQVGKYNLGGARLATHTGYPIIPVAHNAGRFWPRRRFIKIPGTVHVVFGPLIETKDRSPEDVMAEVKEWIESTIQRL